MRDLYLSETESLLLLENEGFPNQCVSCFSLLPQTATLPSEFVECLKSGPYEFVRSAIPEGYRPKLLKREAQMLEEKYGLTFPIQVMVTDSARRLRGKKLSSHVVAKQVPRDSFIRVDDDLYVMSPELTLLNLAEKLPVIELAVQCSKFFSIFASSRESITGLEFRQPLSSKERCLDFLDHCGGVRGGQALRQALDLAIYPAASSREIMMGAIYSWPWRMGGYALGSARFNYEVDTSSYYGGDGKHLRYPDCYFPDLDVSLEYDGRSAHERRAAVGEDAIRRNELASLGITEFIVTKEQMDDIGKLDSIAKAAARVGGSELGQLTPTFKRRQHDLITRLCRCC